MLLDNSRASRRRRGKDFVTQNACKECKRKRAKCDGQSPCARCSSLEIICEYEIPVHVSKSNMRTHIKELETRLEYSEQIFRSLRSEIHASEVLRRLKEGDNTEKIYQYLTSRQSADSEYNPRRQEEWDISSGLSEGGSVPFSGTTLSSETPEVVNYHPATSWTTVTTDSKLVRHLHSLYFSWEHAVCSLFSKYHFVEDRDSGRQRYCSPLLVNVIAALGCKFSGRPEIQKNFANGEQFYLEAEKLWEAEQDETSITTIQATALMSLWEASTGQHRKSAFYSREALSMAIEGCFHSDLIDNEGPELGREVRSATFWGIFTLDQFWSMYLGCLPHLSRRGTFSTPPIVTDGQDQLDWTPYFDDEMRFDGSVAQTSDVRSVFKGICELTHVMYESLHVLHSPTQSLSIPGVIEIYHQYLQWYDSMLQVMKSGQNSTPTAIFAHLLYHFGVILLFGPLIGQSLPSDAVVPTDMCRQASNAVSALIHSHGELYSLRRVHTFVPYISLVSSVALLTISQTQGSISNASLAHVAQGISDLRSMAQSNDFASHAADALQTITTHMFPAAYPSSNSSEDRPRSSKDATYLYEGTPSIPAHHILEEAAASRSSPFSSYLSSVMAEVRDS